MKLDLDQIQHGIVCFTFDDRNFQGWHDAIPLFEKYNAHATFFVHGPIDDTALSTMRELRAHGHTVGLHSLTHANAPEFIAEHGAEEYLKQEIFPQVDVCNANDFPVQYFGYPNNRRTEETDQLLSPYFNRFRAGLGGLKEVYLPDHEPIYRTLASLSDDRVMNGVGIGEYYNTDPEQIVNVIRRAAAENKQVTFFSHNIAPGAPHVHMPTEFLELFLAETEVYDIKAVGFEELP